MKKEFKDIMRTFIQVMALVMTLESAFFLTRGNLGLSAETIVKITQSYWAEFRNPNLIANLADQKADTWIGALLLFGAFVLQMWNTLWEKGWDSFGINRKGVCWALVFSSFLFVGCLFISKKVSVNTQKRVKSILSLSLSERINKLGSPIKGAVSIDKRIPIQKSF
ncbi:MAG: hypothetical protein P9M00_12670 [Candidatus Tritonobacter lacicola]|nr:hypothetical protein [Candidatus Tritonobacter lacicola]